MTSDKPISQISLYNCQFRFSCWYTLCLGDLFASRTVHWATRFYFSYIHYIVCAADNISMLHTKWLFHAFKLLCVNPCSTQIAQVFTSTFIVFQNLMTIWRPHGFFLGMINIAGSRELKEHYDLSSNRNLFAYGKWVFQMCYDLILSCSQAAHLSNAVYRAVCGSSILGTTGLVKDESSWTFPLFW